MPVVRACAACGSMDVQFAVNELRCLNHKCNRLTDLTTGLLVPLDEQFGPDWKDESGQDSEAS
jgi:hypothetical protein